MTDRLGTGLYAFALLATLQGCYIYQNRKDQLREWEHPAMAYVVTTTDPFPGYVLLDYASFQGHRSNMVGDPRRSTPWRYEMFEKVGPDVAEISAVNLGHGCVTVAIERSKRIVKSATGCTPHQPVTVRDTIRCSRCVLETERF